MSQQKVHVRIRSYEYTVNDVCIYDTYIQRVLWVTRWDKKSGSHTARYELRMNTMMPPLLRYLSLSSSKPRRDIKNC